MQRLDHRVALLAALLTTPALAQRDGNEDEGEYIWNVLAARYDADGDGRITAEEYPRGKAKFTAYDADTDGVLTQVDFEGVGGMNFARMALGRAIEGSDLDESGDVEGEEWEAWVSELGADQDGVIPEGAVTAPEGGRGRGANLDRDGDGKLELSDLALVFALVDTNGDGDLDPRELAGRPSQVGAKVGGKAPDFELNFAKEPERKVRLSSFAGDRPVALVFGSYT